MLDKRPSATPACSSRLSRSAPGRSAAPPRWAANRLPPWKIPRRKTGRQGHQGRDERGGSVQQIRDHVIMPTASPENDLLQATGDEVVAHLQALLRLDTRNPPGNEILAANYLRDVLARDGIDSEIVGPSPDRASIIARLRGDGSEPPLLLMSHTDVVAVETRQVDAGPVRRRDRRRLHLRPRGARHEEHGRDGAADHAAAQAARACSSSAT